MGTFSSGCNGMDLIRFKEIVEYNDTGNNTEARMGWLGRINL